MNIFNKVTLQSMKKSRTRTVVTVIGVILSTAMITAVAAFGTSLLHFLLNGSIAKYGNWHVEFSDVPLSFVQKQNDDPEVADTAAFTEIGYAVLDGAKSPEKPYLFIAGFGEEAFSALPISLISGRLPENSSEILVPSHVAVKGGVRFNVGDTLSLAVGKRMSGEQMLDQHDSYRFGDKPGSETEQLAQTTQKIYTVVGICERPGFEEHSAPGYTLITKAESTCQTDRFSLFVTLKKPRNAKNYADSADGSYILNDYVLRFMGISDNQLFNTLMYSVGGILTAIIMVSSVFLIYNSFNISLNERMHQFGILASVGATSKQLRNSVLFEALCVGAAGIPIGIAAGISSIGLLIPIVARNFSSMIPTAVPLTLSVSIPVIVMAAAVSLVTILISAYIPARKAANTPVMECIRQTNEIKTDAGAVKTSKLALRIYGLEGTLALKNFKRNKHRYRSIVLSLALSVILFISGTAFETTLKRLSEQLTVDIDHDILFTADGLDEAERLSLYHRLKDADGVYESQSQTVFEYSCTARTDDLSEPYRKYMGTAALDSAVQLPMYLQFIEDGEYLRFIGEMGLSAEEYTGPDTKMIVFARQEIHKKGGAAREVFDLFAGNSVTLQISSGPDSSRSENQMQRIDATVVDTYPVDLPPMPHDQQDSLVFILLAPYSLKKDFETPASRSHISFGFLSKNPLKSVGEMETIIQDAKITSGYDLYSVYAITDQFRSMTFVINVFTYIFVIMISLIAIANVFNTISTNIKLRRRELAMLRSVGMSDHSFNKMICFECVFYGTRALLFGLPTAGIISWLIYKGLVTAEKLEDLSFEFPWGSMGICILSVFCIVFVTMLYAVGKIKKENIIDSLRDDIT